MTGLYPVLAAALVGVVIAAVWGAGYAIYGRAGGGPFRTRATRVRTAGALTIARHRSLRVIAAVLGGMAVWAVTGWPVGGILTTALVLTVPFFFGGARVSAVRIDRLDALEQWVRHLADSMAVGGMPVQTIQKSAVNAPAAIREEVTRLAMRLSTPRLDKKEALRSFADEIDDSLGDIVVLALQRAVDLRGGERVPMVLKTLAESVAAEVKARRDIEKERSGPRKEMQAMVIFIACGVSLLTLMTDYAQKYATADGQIYLVFISAAVLFTLWLMRKLSVGKLPPRILAERADVDGEVQR